jgi:peroxiredoxin
MTTAAHRAEPPRTRARPASARSRILDSRRPALDALDRDDIWDRMVKPGDRVPALPLLEADLGPIHLDRLRRTGPAVLVFFPHSESEPANAALADYERHLMPALTETDAHLVAVSPQLPGRLTGLKRRHDLSYFVAADPRHQLIDAFNLGFHAPGADVLLGTGRSILPFPAVVITDRAGVVRFADVRPDGAAHLEPTRILEALGKQPLPTATNQPL